MKARRSSSSSEGRNLRKGFSSGAAVAAAARAALRCLLLGRLSRVVSIRLPVGYFIPVPIAQIRTCGEWAEAVVIKDGGDDPDVTHGAAICVRVRKAFIEGHDPAIRVMAGEGVGVVTKPGLPVKVGEPAINPGPREMLVVNLSEEMAQWEIRPEHCGAADFSFEERPNILLPLENNSRLPLGLIIDVEVEVPKGRELAKHTLNPRLGIEGGISILGTTGIVKPFSNKAYEETIEAALSVAAANGWSKVVLSTGGKSEKLARSLLPELGQEAFVQIADFFAFSVEEARRMGFTSIVHSAFFGKVVKMAQGHAYTHAHRVELDLEPLARMAMSRGYDESFCKQVALANTARHALELLQDHKANDLVLSTAELALKESCRIAGEGIGVRLLLFDYNGELLVDVAREVG